VSIRILAIDRHLSVAEAYGRRLAEEPGFAFLGVLSDPTEVERTLRRLRPDLAIVELVCGTGWNGLGVLESVKLSDPSVRCLAVIDLDAGAPALLSAVLRLEPDGVFSKAQGLEELVKAVRCISEGRYWASPDVDLVAGSAAGVTELFSPGELRVVAAMARYGNKAEAASATFYSPETINTYLRRIRKRVAEIEGRASFRLPDLVAWAREQGFHLVDANR
jgi:two-component system invasion response regulator UvrY